jgi:hypothetical protein
MKQINTEGLGSTCTLRGTTSNRFMGDGYAWANMELRWKFVTFDWINQHWALALNPFFDFGGIVQPYRLDAMIDARHNWYQKTDADKTYAEKAFEAQIKALDPTHDAGDYLYSGVKDNVHFGAGMGLHVIMNTNFNISFEFAKCINPFMPGNDGVWGMNVGLNYIF